jgi:hypothetical protein
MLPPLYISLYASSKRRGEAPSWRCHPPFKINLITNYAFLMPEIRQKRNKNYITLFQEVKKIAAQAVAGC